ncbi:MULTISPECIES: carbohydrate ABC transporter permease [Mycobacteriales]|uniref:carbohydrate ABC transporter permease n=1 Tax=Mycobacteriales TaxID=85007 RepID=UPI0009ED606A|nr:MULTISPECIES: carbohydrate ABC transporter permease [Mycobacteriales]MBB1019544.1 carbohydrate ABC transporter permease [Dietzia sp. DQ11-71]MBB1052590.1 carbohydrate ABC transporter permease [Dietzia sp. CW19]MDT0223888.1 carbohydrate ABC transporter permease [Gordonia sp. AC31]
MSFVLETSAPVDPHAAVRPRIRPSILESRTTAAEDDPNDSLKNRQNTDSDLPVGARSVGGIAIGHVILAVAAICSIFPVYWLFATAFRLPEDQLSQSLIPWPISIQNFIDVTDQIPILWMMWNTLVMATALTVFQLFTSILASYAFARFDFYGKSVASFLFIGSWLVPFQITMIPNYLMVSQLGLLNTVAGVVVPNLVSAFGVLMLMQHMRSFPGELLDAAKVDGRNSWQTLWSIVVPNMKPALAALAIMLFITAWNDYLWPSLIMRQSDALIQVGIRSFLTAEGNNWGAVMAAAGMACIPVFLLYIFLQKYVVAGFVRSGMK